MDFYRCNHCGNIYTPVNDSKVPVMCCGEKMEKLIPNTTDVGGEKHVPVVISEGNKITVKVGEVLHPSLPAHYIMWIAIETDKGVQIKYLKPEEEPQAVFFISEGEKVVAAYEYCNLHGLWKKELA